MLSLRWDEHAQTATQDVAGMIAQHVAREFPEIWAAWRRHMKDSITFSRHEVAALGRVLSGEPTKLRGKQLERFLAKIRKVNSQEAE